MCAACFPSADLPSWQEAQLPVTPVWSQLTAVKANVLLWQLSQGAAVTTWLAGLPRPCWPL